MGRTPSIGAEAVRAALVDLDMEVPTPMLEESPCAPSPEPTSAPGPPQLPTLSDAPAAALETAAPVSAVASEEAEAHQGIPLTHADGAVETPRHVTGPIRRPGGTAPTGRVWGTPAATDPLTEFANETASGETLAPAAVLPPTPPSVARRVALAVTAVAMLVLVALLVGALDINPNVDSTGEHSAGSLPHAPASPYDASVSVHGIVVPDEFQASLTDARTRAAGAYLIRAGVRTSRSAADALRSALAGTGLRAGLRQTASTSVERETSNGTYEVIVEGSGTLEDAMAVATRLRLQPGGEGAVVAGMPGAFASSTAAAAR